MKIILLLTGLVTLITTTGCLVSEGGRQGYYRGHERHDEVYVGPPAVVVRAPVLEMRPPEVIVR